MSQSFEQITNQDTGKSYSADTVGRNAFPSDVSAERHPLQGGAGVLSFMSSHVPKKTPSTNNNIVKSSAEFQAFTGATGVTLKDHATVNNASSIMNIYQMPAESKDVLAETLSPIFGAAYNSSEREGLTECTTGTRVDLLHTIDNWIHSTDKASIFWLSGLAGTGKSTVAHSVAHKYCKNGASFFFSRDHKNRSELKNVIKTLAYQLGKQLSPLKDKLLKEIGSDISILNSTLSVQLQRLIYNPIMDIKEQLNEIKIVVVLDALDECQQNIQTNIIKVLAENINQCSFPIKFFVTSRPETSLEYIFQIKTVESVTNSFVLHNIEKSKVNADIRLYIEQEISEMPIQKPWPKPNEMGELIEICSGLFIAASTAMKFIKYDLGFGVQNKLRLILEKQYVKSNGMNPYQSLDDMYMKILLLASKSQYWKDDIFQTVIAIIILGFNNLTIEGIMKIQRLSHNDDGIYKILCDLKAVLLVPPSNSNIPVHAFHLSFHDFLTNAERCSDERFYINTKKHHALIATGCLHTLMNVLKVDICNVGNMSTANRDIPIHNTVTDEIGYAATYWIFHLQEALLNSELEQLATKFIFKYLLQWLEVISLCGQLPRALEGVTLGKKLVSIFKPNCLKLLNDTKRFIQLNYEIINNYALQIYQTALLFTPQKTILYKTYQDQLKTVKIIKGYNKYWDPCVQVLEGHFGKITSVAISEDQKIIVSGSYDTTVRLWDSYNGELLNEFKGHSDWVTSVAISQDGTTIVSGSYDKTVRVWNSQSGKLLNELKGHSDWVNSVAISQDGTTIVSGSDDKTVRVWNSQSGKLLNELKGHLGKINSVAISQDGTTIVSGSYDMTVRVWNSWSGKLLNELKGHSDEVKSVAISHDQTTIVSGSDDYTVRVWNSWSGKLLNELKGHSDWVNSVAISQNGTTIVSGSDDKTIRMWSVQNGTVQMITFNADQTGIIVNSYQFFCIRSFNELGLLHELSETNLNLVVDDWIVNSGRKLFWLPPSFRPANLQAIAINDTTVAIGTALGRMVTISLNTDKWELALEIKKKNKIKELLKETLKLNK